MDDPGAYCREIETYLCRRNDGHLIRIVGPAFERVCGWAQAGVPLQVVVQGIDRKLERHHSAGRKRRPLRIEYCEADILEVFDEWRRAVGVGGTSDRGVNDTEAEIGQTAPPRDDDRPVRRRASLPAHIDRVMVQATNQLAMHEEVPGLHAALEQVVADLDALRPDARGARGTARAALLDRLAAIDRLFIAAVRTATGSTIEGMQDAARAELESFKTRMTETAYARAVTASTDRLLRERYRLPTVRLN
jgi:hypothetical protein